MYRFLLLALTYSLFFSGSVRAQSALEFNMLQAKQAYQSGNYTAAVTYSEQVLEQDSLQLNAYVLKSSSHLALQQPALALYTVDKGINHYPGSTSLQWIKAEAMLQQSRPDGALDLYLDLYQDNRRDNEEIDKSKIAQRLGLIYQAKGGKAFQQNDLDEAESYFKAVRTYMPDSLHSYHNLALVYLQAEKWQEALKIISSGLVKFPGNTELLRMRANALYRTEDYDGVVEQYRELYEQNPNDVETALQYARLLIVQNDQDNAYAIYNELLENHPRNRQVYETIADMYEQRNDHRARRSLLYKMRKQFPNDHSVLEEIARTYKTEEKWQLARNVYDTLRIEKEDPAVEINIARTWEQQDSLRMAWRVYENASKKYPDNTELLRRRGMIEEELDQFDSALKTYQELLALQNNSDNHIRVGRMYEALNRQAEALRHFQMAIDAGTSEPLPYFRAARLMLTDDREQAFRLGRKALEHALTKVRMEQEQIASTLNEQDNLFALKSAGKYESNLMRYNNLSDEIFSFLTQRFNRNKILPLLRNLESEYPNSGRLLFLQSSYYGDIGKTDKQFELLKKSVELHPRFAEGHMDFGNYHAERGQTTQAIQSYERALSLEPLNPDPYRALIDLYRGTGRLDQLIKRWMARYRVRPDNETLQEHLIEALHKAERFEEAQNIISRD